MGSATNPFPASEPDRKQIWAMLVDRDIAAFIAGDWSMVDGDFDAAAFIGIDAKRSDNPDRWHLAFPTLQLYRDEWLRQARDFAGQSFAEDPATAIFRATDLTQIDIADGRALARKKFDGSIKRTDGGEDRLNWQTLYQCRRQDDRWLITGFTGYLPYPMGVGAGG